MSTPSEASKEERVETIITYLKTKVNGKGIVQTTNKKLAMKIVVVSIIPWSGVRVPLGLLLFLGSSMVEREAVNFVVVGSSPTPGA